MTDRPSVITWFKVYTGLMVLIYLVVILVGILLYANADSFVGNDVRPGSNVPADPVEAQLMGMVYAALGVVLSLVFAVGLVIPRRFWGWVYGIVLIAIGLTSCCFWPITIPLLIFWIKPEVKDWYKNEGGY